MAKAIELPDGALLLLKTHCSIPAADASFQWLSHSELEVFKTILGKEILIEGMKHILQKNR